MPVRRDQSNDWHRADIKAALERNGWTLRKLAAHHGISHRALTETFERSYPASERRIADAIGVHPMKIWPSRYFPDGTPNGQRGNPNWRRRSSTAGNRSTCTARRHGKNARAN